MLLCYYKRRKDMSVKNELLSGTSVKSGNVQGNDSKGRFSKGKGISYCYICF